MTAILVDSNVILDVVTEDPQWGRWSAETLARCAEGSILFINPIIYAEVSIGFDRIEEAKELVGYDLAIPSEERVSLPKNSFYEWELAGCRVETIDGAKIGDVKEIMRTGGVEILRVVDKTDRERLIPMASDICVEIDIEKKLIRIDPPEGLLDL